MDPRAMLRKKRASYQQRIDEVLHQLGMSVQSPVNSYDPLDQDEITSPNKLSTEELFAQMKYTINMNHLFEKSHESSKDQLSMT
jgi:hypothetical protein